MNGTHKQIFIVITQTGTMLSRILKRITGAEYNHASLSLSRDLTRMYSFGRRHPYNPFWGGFVIESPPRGNVPPLLRHHRRHPCGGDHRGAVRGAGGDAGGHVGAAGAVFL